MTARYYGCRRRKDILPRVEKRKTTTTNSSERSICHIHNIHRPLTRTLSRYNEDCHARLPPRSRYGLCRAWISYHPCSVCHQGIFWIVSSFCQSQGCVCVAQENAMRRRVSVIHLHSITHTTTIRSLEMCLTF